MLASQRSLTPRNALPARTPLPIRAASSPALPPRPLAAILSIAVQPSIVSSWLSGCKRSVGMARAHRGSYQGIAALSLRWCHECTAHAMNARSFASHASAASIRSIFGVHRCGMCCRAADPTVPVAPRCCLEHRQTPGQCARSPHAAGDAARPATHARTRTQTCKHARAGTRTHTRTRNPHAALRHPRGASLRRFISLHEPMLCLWPRERRASSPGPSCCSPAAGSATPSHAHQQKS